MRNTTAELDELGEEMTTPKYEELVKSLTDAKVALRDANGEFRSTYDIIADIAQQWDKLSSTEQAALITNIAGTRQQDIFQSLVRNFNEASGAMDAMSNSVGALSSAHSTYLDSIEGRSQQLKATFEEFSNKILSSEIYKGLISFLTHVVSLLGTVLSSLGGLPAAITAVTVALTILNLERVKAGLVSIWNSLSSVVTFIPRVIQLIVLLTSKTMAETLATEAAAAGMTKFQVACASLNLNPVVLAISAVIAVVAALGYGIYSIIKSNSLATAEEKLEDASGKLSDVTNKLTELNNELKTTQQRIKELENKDKLTLVEEDELNQLRETNLQLQREIELQKELAEGAQGEVQTSFVDTVKKWKNEKLHGVDSAIDKYNQYQQFLEDPNDGVDLDQADLDMMSKYKDQVREAIQSLQDYKEALGDIGYENLTDEAREYYDYIIDQETKYSNFISGQGAAAFTYFSSDKFKDARTELNQLFKDAENVEDVESAFEGVGSAFDKAFSHDDIQQFADDIGVTYSEAYDILKQRVTEYYSEIVTGGDAASNAIEDQVTALETLKSKLSAVSSEIDSIQSAYDTVNDLIEDYNENGYLSLDNLQSLLQLEPKYLNLLIDENGQLNLNSESYAALAKAKLEELLITQIRATFTDILTNMSVEEAAAYAAAEAYNTETESLYGLIEAETQEALLRASIKDTANNTTVYTDAINRCISTIPTLVSLVDNYSFAAENAADSTNSVTDALNDQKDALEDEKEALEDQKDALEDAKDALEDYKDALSDAKDNIQNLIDLVIDYLKKQKEAEKDILQERKDEFDDLIEKEKEELATKKEAAEFEEKLRSKQNAVAKDALAASIASLDDSAAGKKRKKEADDALIESRDDLYSTLADHEYDIRVDALDALKTAQDEYYDAEIAKINDYLDNERQLYEDACAEIENDTGDLYDRLWAYTYAYTTKTRAEFDYLWTSAQEAISEYGGTQIGVINIMEYLQREIYNTESKIDDLDGQIDELDTTIDILSQRIDDVSDQIDSLGNESISNLTDQINNLKTALDGLGSNKWYYDFRGRRFSSQLENRADAVQDLLSKVQNAFSDSPYVSDIYGGIQHYAKGTYSATGGVSRVNEEGHEIRVLNKGDGILTAQITKNLSNLGADPVGVLADAGKELFSKLSNTSLYQSLFGTKAPSTYNTSTSSNQPISISNTIHGDVNPSTLKALVKAQEEITKNAINGMMKKTLGLRSSGRVK